MNKICTITTICHNAVSLLNFSFQVGVVLGIKILRFNADHFIMNKFLFIFDRLVAGIFLRIEIFAKNTIFN